jgi:arylformamidase
MTNFRIKQKPMKIIDISMELNHKMMVYPGNPKPEIKRYASLPARTTNESLLVFGSHTGTHVDAPLHIRNSGKTTDEIPLAKFFGPCRVLDLTAAGREIRPSHLVPLKIRSGEIILLKTENSLRSYRAFRRDYAHLTVEAAEYLVRKKIKALGVDYLSVTKFNTADKVHATLVDRLALIEGLVLSHVRPGRYWLAAFPLKIKCDGAPLRAVLIKP